jgi:hypothetical protein
MEPALIFTKMFAKATIKRIAEEDLEVTNDLERSR